MGFRALVRPSRNNENFASVEFKGQLALGRIVLPPTFIQNFSLLQFQFNHSPSYLVYFNLFFFEWRKIKRGTLPDV